MNLLHCHAAVLRLAGPHLAGALFSAVPVATPCLPACLSPLPYPTRLSASLPYLQEAKRGLGTSAVFIARNRFAVLDRAANTIQIRNLQNEITKKCAPPCATTDAVFYAGTGMLLCRSEDKVGICTHLPISLMR